MDSPLVTHPLSCENHSVVTCIATKSLSPVIQRSKNNWIVCGGGGYIHKFFSRMDFELIVFLEKPMW